MVETLNRATRTTGSRPPTEALDPPAQSEVLEDPGEPARGDPRRDRMLGELRDFWPSGMAIFLAGVGMLGLACCSG